MEIIFYTSAAIAVVSTALVITSANAVHSLLYLVVSLLSVSAIFFFVLGAPFVGMLEVIIYAGAIMVLFIFVIMMLNLGPAATEQEEHWLRLRVWRGPSVLALILLAELVYAIKGMSGAQAGPHVIGPNELGKALYGPYILIIELASLLLLSGLVGAYHLGRRERPQETKELHS